MDEGGQSPGIDPNANGPLTGSKGHCMRNRQSWSILNGVSYNETEFLFKIDFSEFLSIYSGYTAFIRYAFCKYLLPMCRFLAFTFLRVSLKEQNFKILMQSGVSVFSLPFGFASYMRRPCLIPVMKIFFKVI